MELVDFHLIAVYELPAEITIYFMKIQPVLPSQQTLYEKDVPAYFLYVSGTPRIVPRCLNSYGERFDTLEADHVVGLPAM